MPLYCFWAKQSRDTSEPSLPRIRLSTAKPWMKLRSLSSPSFPFCPKKKKGTRLRTSLSTVISFPSSLPLSFMAHSPSSCCPHPFSVFSSRSLMGRSLLFFWFWWMNISENPCFWISSCSSWNRSTLSGGRLRRIIINSYKSEHKSVPFFHFR